jgi:hypothetical protein
MHITQIPADIGRAAQATPASSRWVVLVVARAQGSEHFGNAVRFVPR